MVLLLPPNGVLLHPPAAGTEIVGASLRSVWLWELPGSLYSGLIAALWLPTRDTRQAERGVCG